MNEFKCNLYFPTSIAMFGLQLTPPSGGLERPELTSNGTLKYVLFFSLWEYESSMDPKPCSELASPHASLRVCHLTVFQGMN